MTTPTITGTPQVGQTLTASIGDIRPPVAYRWNSAGKPISGATSATYVPVAADVGNIITVTVAAVSPPTAAAIDIIPTNSVLPTISGTAQVGDILTATTGTWTHRPTSYAIQWANGSIGLIPGATGLTYVPTTADVGFALAALVVATNSGGRSAAAESALTGAVLPAIRAIPVNTAVPVIAGNAQIGQTLSASTGGWTNSPTSFAYQWSDSATGPIGGATASAYVPTSANLGHTLTVSVVATNAVGPSTPATSAATSAVIDIIPTISTLPTISGTAQVGQTLTAFHGTWTHNPTGYTYQWVNSSTGAIPGAAGPTYVPTSSDVGFQIVVFVVAHNSGGASTAIASAATAVVTASSGVPVNSGLPVISGTAQVGQTLTTTNGAWTNSPTSYAYQWKSAGVNATGTGANTASYSAVAADVGNPLTVTVTATNGVGSGSPATSAATSAVIDVIPTLVTLPTISGTAQVGQTLTASPGTWTHNPTSYAYQWGNTSIDAISGATGLTYVPTSSDVGFQIVVFVVAHNSGGNSTSIASAATAVVTASSGAPVNTGLPVISGTAQTGQTLTTTNGAWTNSPTSYAYQWTDSATGAIGGATANTYVPVSGNVGHTLTVSVIATNSGGSSAPATSAATGAVAGAGPILPPDRNFAWNPGMMAKGGVPARATIFKTLAPIGGGADDSVAIQAALDSCPDNQVVLLGPGTFTLNNYVLVHSITLRGSGAGVTILNKANGAHGRSATVVPGTTGILTPQDPGSYTYDAQPLVIVGPSRYPGPDNSTSQGLTADGAQGAASVTVANAAGFAAGQFVLLDELSGASWQAVPPGFGCADNLVPTPCPPLVWQGDRVAWAMHWPQQVYADDAGNSNASGPYDTTPGVPPAAMSWFCRTGRPTNEMKEVASVSGNTITFTSPLAIGYRVSHSAQLTRYTPTGSASTANSVHVTNAGVENLSMVGGADGELRFEAAAYSWAKHVEVTQWIGEGVAIDNSFRVEIRDSYIHTGSWPSPGGAGYALSLANGSSEALIENNILIDTCKDIVVRSCGAGSVVAYNYADDPWDNNATTWQEVGLNASHMAGPHHVLFEGNFSHNFDSDYTHGNAIYLTVFRNVLTGQRRDFTDIQNPRAVGLAYGSWWDSFLGNILGRSGQMAGWSYADKAMGCDANGGNCVGAPADWSTSDVWKLGYDPSRWGMSPDPQVLATVIRDGNYDFLTNSQRWHTTPGGFALPSSLYLAAKPAFFGTNPWPWSDPATGTIHTLPAKARYDAGAP